MTDGHEVTHQIYRRILNVCRSGPQTTIRTSHQSHMPITSKTIRHGADDDVPEEETGHRLGIVEYVRSAAEKGGDKRPRNRFTHEG